MAGKEHGLVGLVQWLHVSKICKRDLQNQIHIHTEALGSLVCICVAYRTLLRDCLARGLQHLRWSHGLTVKFTYTDKNVSLYYTTAATGPESNFEHREIKFLSNFHCLGSLQEQASLFSEA